MSARIYLAARYSRREELLHYGNQLMRMGFEVVSTWIDGHHEVPGRVVDDGERYHAEDIEIRGWATEDLLDVLAADCVISFTEPEGAARQGRGGRHVELGIGLGKGAVCVIVGPREHVFHYLEGVHQFDDWADARNALPKLLAQ